MKYCKKCVMPDTRPGLYFDESGVCSACRWSEEKQSIDWKERGERLLDIAENAINTGGNRWDCVVGVSGGKDSTWQAMFVRDRLGLNPLLVQYAGSDGTEVGRKNIENLSRLGFDLLTLKPNPAIARKLSLKSFRNYGNLVKYSDAALFPVPIRAAMAYEIPLVMFGANPAIECGDTNFSGDPWDALNIISNNTLGGDNIDIWIDEDVGIRRKDLISYQFPSRNELIDWGGEAIYMGYFINWSDHRNAVFSLQNGFSLIDAPLREIGNISRHNSLDSNNGGIVNAMLKHMKLGFGNATEFICYDIREGRVTREEAIAIVKEIDGGCHPRYVEAYCRWVGIGIEEFWSIADSYRGSMWDKDEGGEWRLKNPIWEQEPPSPDIDVDEVLNRIDTYKESLRREEIIVPGW